jgi:hypothetical protein
VARSLFVSLLVTTVPSGGMTLQLLKRANPNPKLGGRLHGDSLDGRSLKGWSPDKDPLRRPPPNPHVGLYGWATPNPKMFIPSW